MVKEFRVYSTVTGEFDFVSIVDLMTSDNSRISKKMVKDDLTVEQFTGLKDCEGVKIYEGDILEEERGYYFQVEFDRSNVKLKLKAISRAIQYPEWNRGIKMTVIGNIHRNPELLEEKQ